MTRELKVTSYAILGLLAMREWSAYDLAKEMQRNLVFFWPRAESAIYVEAKRLGAAGFASASVELHGRRRRTTYAITAAGRDALAKWLAQPAGRGVQLESEGVLRVFLAGALPPDRATVLDALDAVERDARAIVVKAWLVGGEFLDGVAPFQDQLRWRAHVHSFHVRYALMLLDWVRDTRTTVEGWNRESETTARAIVADARAQLQTAVPVDRSDPDPTPQGKR